MRIAFIGFCLGWFMGASLMWWHFKHSKLIRNREEWYRAQGRDDD